MPEFTLSVPPGTICSLGVSVGNRTCRNIASRHVTYPSLGPDDEGSWVCDFHWNICRERGVINADGEWS